MDTNPARTGLLATLVNIRLKTRALEASLDYLINSVSNPTEHGVIHQRPLDPVVPKLLSLWQRCPRQREASCYCTIPPEGHQLEHLQGHHQGYTSWSTNTGTGAGTAPTGSSRAGVRGYPTTMVPPLPTTPTPPGTHPCHRTWLTHLG